MILSCLFHKPSNINKIFVETVADKVEEILVIAEEIHDYDRPVRYIRDPYAPRPITKKFQYSIVASLPKMAPVIFIDNNTIKN